MKVTQDGWGKIIALIASKDGDIAGAEDALATALERAVGAWRTQGVPDNPEGWLYRVAMNARRDVWKSAAFRTSVEWDPELHDAVSSKDPGPEVDLEIVPDRRLELLAACAHPDIEPADRSLLMLSAVMGLTTKQIAVGMALPSATVAARLTRAKKRVISLGIRFGAPDRADLALRLHDIREVIYGVFAIEWVHAAAEPREGLVGEALYLSELLTQLCPGVGESHALAALIHLSAARFPARRGAAGEFVPLDQQDPRSWNAALVARGEKHLHETYRSGEIGRFGLEAAIQVLHMAIVRDGRNEWPALLRLHDDLARIAPTLGGLVARAAVVAKIDGAEAGLTALDTLEGLADTSDHPGVQDTNGRISVEKRLGSFQPAWALRAHLLSQCGHSDKAVDAYRQAISLTTDPRERSFLETRSRL